MINADFTQDLKIDACILWGGTLNTALRHATVNGLVAQLDRALDYESRGRGFESSPDRHLPKSSDN